MTGIIHSITQTLRSNLRQGGLVIALVAIVLLFAVLTDGQILSAQNVSNIIVQNAYVLVLAIGMLFAILMADIDLSVGSVVALTGAVAGVVVVNYGMPWGIMTVVYIAVFMVIGFVTAAINPFLHAFSPAITGLVVGTIYLFLAIKVPKFGVFTISQLLLIMIVLILGMGYLPWLIGMFIGALLGDIAANTSKYKNKYTIAIASG